VNSTENVFILIFTSNPEDSKNASDLIAQVLVPVQETSKKFKKWWVTVGSAILLSVTTLISQIVPLRDGLLDLFNIHRFDESLHDEVLTTVEVRKGLQSILQIISQVNPNVVAVAVYNRLSNVDFNSETIKLVSEYHDVREDIYFENTIVFLQDQEIKNYSLDVRGELFLEKSILDNLKLLDCQNLGVVGRYINRFSQPIYGLACPTYSTIEAGLGLEFNGLLVAGSLKPWSENNLEPTATILFGNSHKVVSFEDGWE
jgi:hypothetical protein